MGHNVNISKSVYLKTARGTKLYGERRRPDASNIAASLSAAAHPTPAPDPKTFPEATSERKALIKSEQHQIEIMAGQSIRLKNEISLLIKKEAQARHLAYHDGLTGLPNRNLLQDRFQQAMSQAVRHHKPLALLMIELDELKSVNDTLGHVSGDRLLQAVAWRLGKGIRGADTACRYGGDEFVIMLSEIDSPNIATTLAVELGWRLSEPYILDGHIIHMAVNVGVAVYPDNGQTFDDLMKQADAAMCRTKGTRHRTSVTKQPTEDIVPGELANLSAPTAG